MDIAIIVATILACYVIIKIASKLKNKRRAKKDVTVQTVDRYVQIIVESLKIARRSKNRETKISRLAVAKDNFSRLVRFTESHENISFNGLNDVEKLIRDVEVELSNLDDLSSNSSDQIALNNQVINFESAFPWSRIKKQNEEIFWADQIKDYRDDPEMRLRIAIENLPFPAAFREAAIALRAIIRDKRKNGAEYQDQLNQLYWLAAVNSFSVPYSEVLNEPGFNIMESMPKSEIKNFAFKYEEIGYKNLALLNKTDIKWITELWGEPINHSTLHVLYNDIWKKYELKALDDKNKFLAAL